MRSCAYVIHDLGGSCFLRSNIGSKERSPIHSCEYALTIECIWLGWGRINAMTAGQILFASLQGEQA